MTEYNLYCKTNPCDKWRYACQECAVKDCPGGDPFHYDPEGCRYCMLLKRLPQLTKDLK